MTCARLESAVGEANKSETGYTNGTNARPGNRGHGHGWIDDVPAWLDRMSVDYREKPPSDTTRRYEIRICPWNDHSEWKCVILWDAGGRVSAACVHADCTGRTLRDFRDAIEPGWDRRRDTPRRKIGVSPQPSAATEPEHAEEQADDEPLELTSPVGAVQPFPLETLPPDIQAFVRTVTAAIHCPLDYVAMPLLVYASAAIGNSACLEIKGGWCEYARFWLAIVGDPGDKKSPALAKVQHVIEERQHAQHATWEAACARWRQDGKDSDEPRLGQLFTTDATIEALGDLLHENPRGMLVTRDELSEWALAMNEYKRRGADRQHWLALWSGAPLMVNRRSRRRPLYVKHPSLLKKGCQ
jgi:Protein of unknown function (DUF3987)